MRKLVLAVLVIIFAACSNEKPKDPTSTIFVEEELRDFIKFNPEWTKDEATEVQTTEKFKHKLINLSNEPNFLNNMPFQLKQVKYYIQ